MAVTSRPWLSCSTDAIAVVALRQWQRRGGRVEVVTSWRSNYGGDVITAVVLWQ